MSPDEIPLEVSATVILVSKDHKVLIVKRLPEGRWANKWAVIGGHLKEEDGIFGGYPDIKYFPAEYCVIRELEEETGIKIYDWVDKLKYLATIVTLGPNNHRLILSYYLNLDKNADEYVVHLTEAQEYKWICGEDILYYDFVPDIGGEIREVLNKCS